MVRFGCLQLGIRTRGELASNPGRTTINGDVLAIDVRSSATSQVDNRSSNILRLTQATKGVSTGKLVRTSTELDEAVGHLAREETRADGVDGDEARAQFDGEVATQVQDGSLGSRVAIGTLLAERAGSEGRNARGNDDAGRVFLAGALLQHRGEQADSVEDGTDVEVHDLGKGVVRVRVEMLAPGGSRVGQQNVDVVGVLAHLVQKVLNASKRRRVGGHGDGFGAGG